MTAEFNDKTHRTKVHARPGNKFTLDGQRDSLPCTCQTCKKPIFDGKQCWACATGRVRTILRPEERVA